MSKKTGRFTVVLRGIKPVPQALDAKPENVYEANVGDKAVGSIKMGDNVAVLGEHAYHGYHKVWHEFIR